VTRLRTLLLVATAALLFAQSKVSACAVCFGDPDSKLTKGAFAGVLVLFGIIATVLAGLVGTGFYWSKRSRMLADLDSQDPH
jgi:hypothetical protein